MGINELNYLACKFTVLIITYLLVVVNNKKGQEKYFSNEVFHLFMGRPKIFSWGGLN